MGGRVGRVSVCAAQPQLTQLRGMLVNDDGPAIEALFARAQTARLNWIAAIEAAEQSKPFEQGGD